MRPCLRLGLIRAFLFVCSSASLSFLSAQQLGVSSAQNAAPSSPPVLLRDPQAVQLLTTSFAKMGGSLPADISLTGNIEIVEGSLNENGTIRVLVRNADQSDEIIDAASDHREVTYSKGLAGETRGQIGGQLSLEVALTSFCPDVPLPLVARAVTGADESVSYVGLESLPSGAAHHLRTWSSFTSAPKMQRFAELTVNDIWIDAASMLPVKVAYEKWVNRNGVRPIPTEVAYSNYRNSGGFLFPSTVNKKFNGMPWETITFESFATNTGLSDANFPIPARRKP